MRQTQFLQVVSEAEAHRRIAGATAHLAPRGETVPLASALGRVLSEDVRAPLSVPAFDRSNVDGFAVRAASVTGATELEPVRLRVPFAARPAGRVDEAGLALEVSPGEAMPIATGAVVPRGADAVVMVEDTHPADAGWVHVSKAVAVGSHVTWAGTDLGQGEVVLRAGARLGARETGLLAAIGLGVVPVVVRPRVLVLSTGDEVRAPGAALGTGEVFDSNQRIVCDTTLELGGEPIAGGILPDDETKLLAALRSALGLDDDSPPTSRRADMIVLSGGTSKGQGDLNGRVVEQLALEAPDSPGILVHGVALKPGKPFCFAVVASTPVVILPGFPTSAIFTFQALVAPLIRRLAGRPEREVEVTDAHAPVPIEGAPGRTRFALVSLIAGRTGPSAYPLGSGSGSVSTFSRADGYVRIPSDTAFVPVGARVEVHAIGSGRRRPWDLVCIGSHCPGLDALVSLVAQRGLHVQAISVGSEAGLRALARGEGDVAGTHLLCRDSGVYNLPFLPAGSRLLRGYSRRQGVVFRSGDSRFAGLTRDRLGALLRDPTLRMVNRNPGAGTRVVIDGLLEEARVDRPAGYEVQARSHHAVAAAVAQRRADWGVTLEGLADAKGLGFLFVTEERFDLAVREASWDKPAVVALREILASEGGRAALAELGLVPA